jgi:hypothetical protein
MSDAALTVKMDRTFVRQAQREAAVLRRSVGAQLEYWARLGRAIENSPAFSREKVRKALEGTLTVDDLGEVDRRAVFAGLGDAFAQPTEDEAVFYARIGATPGAVGRDDDDRPVRRAADGSLAPR